MATVLIYHTLLSNLPSITFTQHESSPQKVVHGDQYFHRNQYNSIFGLNIYYQPLIPLPYEFSSVYFLQTYKFLTVTNHLAKIPL
jgi:hypothetical protein